ncbi:hypothetical protein J3R30DRAFT_736965 [Lentinula aciculospora]|uniref:Protein Zds1 C-terminal domain-containing protein n=1 Tax=Lentinula aciculospora TaxID=153920 RepID=A0A9W9A6A5_9AGAR|nr:hypothetical protein J3R30DRAFT_736965 [Lentinula aciculospora]
MQPSTYDIQREVEALRDIRRRSTTPGALTIDPDLPNQTSPASSTYSWSGGSTTDDSSSSSNEDGSSSSTGHTTVETENPADDPFHLFWVPASVHPEIAPAEFREFLREHSRSPPPVDGAPVSRSGSLSSLSSGALGRKKSMLSRQYRPSENDGVEDQEERIVPLSRTRSTRYGNQGPQLTISDLQKLEQLAEEASESDDPSKLRNILRRSLSLNISPTAIEQMKNMPDMGDEADAPIIIPPRGQILRRTNRTKIRKPALPGDGGGHRFGASRRGGRSAAATVTTTSDRTSSDHSSSDHEPEVRPRLLSNEFPAVRPDSFSEETSIYDAYVNEEEEAHPDTMSVTTSPPPQEEVTEAPRVSLQQASVDTPSVPMPVSIPARSVPDADIQPALVQPIPDAVLHQPQPQRLLSPQVTSDPSPNSRTPSPPSPITETPASPPSFLSSPPPPHQHHHRKEKDKKGLFGKWGSDKSGKKAKDHTRNESAEKEKDSGFFGSLFGGKKSKDSENSAPSSSAGHTAGREAAQALLGASKSSKSYQPPPSPGAQAINNYSRYPIHVERAIYRLSHIKLANPRRPLYEQVLISNLMFWYLGVINKAQNPQANGQAGAGPAAVGGTAASTDKEQQEKEQREAEQREKERQEQEMQEREQREQREQRERELELKKQKETSPKRGPLTKPAPMGTGGGRRAEIPIRGPQYEMQHREMEQAYGGYGGFNGGPASQQNVPPGRRSPGQGQRTSPSPQSAPRLVQSADSQAPDNFYYPSDTVQSQPQPLIYAQQQQQRLPPGAMPPVEKSNWSASGSPRQSNSSPPPLLGSSPQRRSRSPPNAYNPQGTYGNIISGGGRAPGRSLSATAVPSPSPSPPNLNGRIRKGSSAHAVPSKARPRTPESQLHAYPANRVAEEEDVPLAVWQQQRKR